MMGLMKPKYMTLVEALESMIQSMGKNEMIPSERVLAKEHNLSRMTVRKAIDYLVDQNKLYRVNKVGTFTTDEKLYKKVDAFSGFTNEVRRAGGEPSSELIEYSLQAANKHIAANLGIKEGDLIYKVIRLRKKNGVPIMIDEAHFPQAIIPLNEQVVTGSIYDYIQNTLGLKIVTANQRFKATFAKKEYQKYLEIDELTPVIRTELHVYLEDGRIFEFNHGYINTDRYEIVSKSYQ